jgi:ribosomal protein S18 acetylase RimI-like enzyme
MARSIEGIQHDPHPHIRVGSPVRVGPPESEAEYIAVRQMVDSIFRGGARQYDQETDFYSAPGTMEYIAVWHHDEVISGASFLIVDGIANIWSVATRESARGRGVASIVVHACLVEAHRIGAHAASLGTTEDLARPRGLYNRLGFETIGHEIGWTINDVDSIDTQTL